MNTNRCMKCGASNPEHKLNYLSVDARTKQIGQYRQGNKTVTEYQTTEQFSGGEQYVVCDKCIKERRFKDALFSGLVCIPGGIISAYILLAIFMNKSTFNKNASTIFICVAILGVIVGIIVFVTEMMKKTEFVAAGLLKKSKGEAGANLVFIPMKQSLYVSGKTGLPDFEKFKSKTGLKTGVGATIFAQFIATGICDHMDFGAQPQKQEEKKAPAAKPVTAEPVAEPAAKPVSSTGSLLEDSVNKLLAMYQGAPEGFLKSQAGAVRQIGEDLYKAGGMELMLKAQEMFAARNPLMACNLENMWDGIGKQEKNNTESAEQTVSDCSKNGAEDILQKCVDNLVLLYQGKSTGFYETDAEAGEVRKVGKELNNAGGIELMVQAYYDFANQRPECARNLESLWSGIGEWMG